MPVVTDTNVVQLQTAVSQQWDALQASFDAAQLAGKIPASSPLATQESSMNSRVLAYLAMTPSFLTAAAQMDQGQALQRDLNAYADQLRATGASNVPADVNVPAPMDLFGSLQGIGGLIIVFMVLQAFNKR